MATIYQVSELAGVSLATVSRVMNKSTKVSEKTTKKVQEAMAQLNYRPNSIAQSLASNCTNSVGLMVTGLSGAFFGQMMAGIESTLRRAGKHVIITTGHSEETREKDGIEFLKSRNCDALIVHVEAVSDEYLIDICKGDIPIYLIGNYIEEIKENCIALDNELGGYLAATAVLEQGHRNIAYISGPVGKADAQQRLLGHQRALAQYNISDNEQYLFTGNYLDTGGRDGIKHFLDNDLPFSALVCANDEMASGAMTYAREYGLVLPRDLSVVGFDNVIFARHIHPKLTTIENPVYQMGSMAAKLVLKNIYQHNELIIEHHFKPSLVTRNSVAEQIAK